MYCYWNVSRAGAVPGWRMAAGHFATWLPSTQHWRTARYEIHVARGGVVVYEYFSKKVGKKIGTHPRSVTFFSVTLTLPKHL